MLASQLLSIALYYERLIDPDCQAHCVVNINLIYASIYLNNFIFFAWFHLEGKLFKYMASLMVPLQPCWAKFIITRSLHFEFLGNHLITIISVMKLGSVGKSPTHLVIKPKLIHLKSIKYCVLSGCEGNNEEIWLRFANWQGLLIFNWKLCTLSRNYWYQLLFQRCYGIETQMFIQVVPEVMRHRATANSLFKLALSESS